MRKISLRRNNSGARIVITLVIALLVYFLLWLLPILSLRISHVLSYFGHDSVFTNFHQVQQTWDTLNAKAALLEVMLIENAQLRAQGRYVASTTLGTQGLVVAVPGIMPYDQVQVKVPAGISIASGTIAWASTSVPIGTTFDQQGSYVPVSWWSTPGRTTEVRIGDAPEVLSAIGMGAGVLFVEVPRGVINVVVGTDVSLASMPESPIGSVSSVNDDPRDPYVRVTITLFHSVWKTAEVYFQ